MAGWHTEPLVGPQARSARRARLRVTSGPDEGLEARLEGRALRVGQGPGNELRLTDQTVSRQHAVITSVDDGYRVEDLGSTNGTRINGVRVEVAFIEGTCTLQVGNTALEVHVEDERVEVPASPMDRFGMVVGRSLRMREIFEELKRYASTSATVLLTGETGTGKEAVASSLVAHSDRAGGPLVVVDCGALTPSLIESELYGHEKGAFTGAERVKAGAFERADGGTLLLDEVGELPLTLQPKLLRVLESREVQRVGGSERRPVDFRLIAATHRPLEQRVNDGSFRADLYYRISVLRVHLPPLRERREDIPQLAAHFLMQLDADPSLLDDATVERLKRHDWPGNVRELRNAVERLAFGSDPLGSGARISSAPTQTTDEPIDLETPYRVQKDRLVGDFERRYAEALKAYSPDNVSKAARKAGLNRMAVVKLWARHDLDD